MNCKKILTSLMVLAGALIISTCTNTVQAADYNLGITKDRSETVVKPGYPKYQYKYVADDIDIWKIVNYHKAGDVNDQTEYASDKTIYCLDQGLGFVNAFQNGVDHSIVAKKYSGEINLKDPDALAALQKLYPNNKVFDSTSKEYKALLRIIDKAYIPGVSNKEEFLSEVPYDEKKSIFEHMEMIKKGDIEYKANDDITDSDIDMLQQLVIWHYTNGDKDAFKSDTLKTVTLNYKVSETSEAKEGSYNDIFRIETEDDNIDYGNYRFEYLKKLYEYLITEADKAAEKEEPYENDGLTTATVLLAEDGAQKEQPVVVITRKPQILDLSLRTFITEKNGEKITNRIPQVNIQKLVNGEDSTAIYNHPKYSIKVEEGDINTYTIRIYNEGNVDAKVYWLIVIYVLEDILINVGLGVFNLIPLPPLDGSKIISGILPYNARNWFEKNAQIFYIVFLFIWITGIAGLIISSAIKGITGGLLTIVGKIFGIDLATLAKIFGI